MPPRVKKVDASWCGDVLRADEKRISYKAAKTGKGIYSLGQCIEVRKLTGPVEGIVLQLWESRKKGVEREKMVKVLEFTKEDGTMKNERELLLTSDVFETRVEYIVRAIEVLSYDEFEKQGGLKWTQKMKRGIFFCRYGYHSRFQKRTKEQEWTELYTAEDRTPDNLLRFQEKVAGIIQQTVDEVYKNSKLKDKTVLKKPKIQYVISDSETGSESSSAVDEDSDSDFNPSGRVRRRRSLSSDEEADREIIDVENGPPVTPRKRKPPAALKSPRTPKTPKRFTTVTTPGSRGSYRVHAPLEVTPLPNRVKSLALAQLSPHQRARQRLHVAEVPTSLPCREEEFSNILDQVESAVIENESALIYISGTPGTGKTATVREVIRTLQYRVSQQELFPFKFVEINGMKITDPTQAYSKLWETLTGQRVTPNHALSLLQAQFSRANSSRVPCVVLMDELDQLATTKQEVMYNFFQWPNMPHAKLIVIAVANTMDLPERTLAHKVSSRLGLVRIGFTAYTKDQLSTIIKSRLTDVSNTIVDADAIMFACAKVSAVSGDARRALDICRRAFELAEPEYSTTPSKRHKGLVGKVTIAVMQAAVREMANSPLQKYLKSLPLLGKIFLKALSVCIRRSGLSENLLGEVVEDTTRLCKISERKDMQNLLGAYRPIGIMKIAEILSEAGIIYLEARGGERHSRIRLKIPEQDLMSAWVDDLDVRGV